MSSGPGPEPEEYQLVVAGALGPVLRHALAPYATATTEVRLVVRPARRERSGEGQAPRGDDLVDVLARLESKGVEVSAIQRLL